MELIKNKKFNNNENNTKKFKKLSNSSQIVNLFLVNLVFTIISFSI